MKTAPISEVVIGERQRAKHSPAHVADLKKSILSKGLLHPPVLTTANLLVAGYGRYLAIKELHEDGLAFSCDNEPVAPGRLPYLSISDLSPSDLAEAELEENILRAALSWQEEAQARVLILNLRKQQNPTVSRTEVARELAEKSDKNPSAENVALQRSELVVKHLSNPRVANSKSLTEAHRAIQDMYGAQLRKALVSKGIVKTEHKVILGDCRTELPKLESATVDTILCDPPYGINADTMKKTAKHLYEDTPSYGLDISKLIIREGFRLLKPRGILLMFCDIDHFKELRDYAAQQAYSTFRTPFIWQKGIEGHAPWGTGGFIRTYEIGLLAVKGQKELKRGGPDILSFRRPARSERDHAAEKPVELLSYLLTRAGDAGDVVLDPCAGSGPVLSAASAVRMRAIAIELDPDYHASAVARLAEEPAQAPEAESPEAELLA